MLSVSQGKKLIKYARHCISHSFNDTGENIPDDISSEFSEKQGVFVTLKKKGMLRGCIGFPEPVLPLADAVKQAAYAAAFEDPRFPPVSQEEWKDISVEMSVLTVPKEIIGDREELPQQITIGTDGLIIRGPYGSGLLLPQVFSEYNCSAKQALEMTCQKAGLGADAWKESDNRIFSFQAQIFEEK